MNAYIRYTNLQHQYCTLQAMFNTLQAADAGIAVLDAVDAAIKELALEVRDAYLATDAGRLPWYGVGEDAA